ncbi:glycosyltransferase [Candidatus Woesearchaeota archaeon]|nr:MAG: glycosyltransferase [Candidatus Woesearchaeota archaeon]
MDRINPEEEARKRGITDKFTTERACAREAHVFTTVSEITGMEAEKFFGRKPDILLLNGLDIDLFPTFEETSVKHIVTRSIIREFLTYYFFPYYSFDLEHTLNFFIVGRYEFKNKGIDIFIEALGRLNARLKTENPQRTVAAFIFVPSAAHGIKTELLENKTFYQHIKDYVSYNSKEIQKRIVQQLVSGKVITEKSIFTDDFQIENKRQIINFKRTGQPPLVTHNIDEENDAIINAFKKAGLLNREEDRVKVIYYPVYLTGTDGLLDLSYYDTIAGCHLGVFPSYYEPWGYTPLESAALGVPAITSDMAGFGRFILKHIDNDDVYSGIRVLKRMNEDEAQQIENLAGMMFNFSKLNRHERIKNKLDAKRIANLADWKELFNNYVEAHNLAITR